MELWPSSQGYCPYVNRDPKAPAIVPGVGTEEMGAARKSGSQATVPEGRALACLSRAGSQHFPGHRTLPHRASSTVWPT